ncbi:MAG TPA: DUF72 domain-containing protein [Phycisphaerales bacterium]|nr:DUF72 domain-containing protein [Phycisphaerales bacterium]
MASRAVMEVFVGTSGYAYREWKGKFYPKDLPAKGMLRYYAERFGAVELNGSFYRLPTAASLEALAAQAPDGFRFAMKAPQAITHFQRLKGSEKSAAEFVKVAAALGDKGGPLLFGLPPNMKKDVGRLDDFLAELPLKGKGAVQVAFEFRHASWFDDEVLGVLRERGAALCVADADDELKVPREATAAFGYVRLRRDAYSTAALKEWALWVKGRAWSAAYVFFKHEDEARGVGFAELFAGLMK